MFASLSSWLQRVLSGHIARYIVRMPVLQLLQPYLKHVCTQVAHPAWYWMLSWWP